MLIYGHLLSLPNSACEHTASKSTQAFQRVLSSHTYFIENLSEDQNPKSALSQTHLMVKFLS